MNERVNKYLSGSEKVRLNGILDDFILFRNQEINHFSEAEKKLSIYLDENYDVDGFFVPLYKKDFFTDNNISTLKAFIAKEIDFIQKTDQFKNQISESEEKYLELTFVKKLLLRPFLKIGTLFRYMNIIIILFLLPIPIGLLYFSFRRDITPLEMFIEALNNQIEMLEIAEKQKSDDAQKRIDAENKKAEKVAEKAAEEAYRNSPKGQLEKEIQKIITRMYIVEERLQNARRNNNTFGISVDTTELSQLNAKLNALYIKLANI